MKRRALHSCTSFNIFDAEQKQRHSILHKVAQKMNKLLMKWLPRETKRYWTEDRRPKAGYKDVGGNTLAIEYR